MRKIFIKNSIGQSLAALFYPSSDISNQNKIIIVCHGFKGSKEGRGKALEMADLFSNYFNVVLFDFRGCGESEGNFEDITLTGQIDDLNSVVNWAIDNGYDQIGCVGRSFGGTTVICTASKNKNILSVVGWAAPADLKSTFAKEKFSKRGEFYITYSEEKELKIKETFFEDLKKYDVFSMIKAISPRPVFILHSDKDEVVSCDTAYKLFEAADEPKKLEIIKGDDHIFSKNYKTVWEMTLNWFKETLV